MTRDHGTGSNGTSSAVLNQGGGRAQRFNRWEWSWRTRSRKARPTIAGRWLG